MNEKSLHYTDGRFTVTVFEPVGNLFISHHKADETLTQTELMLAASEFLAKVVAEIG